MSNVSQKEAAKRFSEYWEGKGYEKGQSQPFWLSLLREVFGISEPEKFISFEDQVHIDNTSFIDGYIDSTHVMIEQKSLGKDLRKPIRQSDGTYLTPYEQARRYTLSLPYSKIPRWIVTSNFESFLIYDMEHPSVDPQLIYLKDLPEEYWRMEFLVDDEKRRIQKEESISKDAGKIIKQLYEALAECYGDMDDPVNQKSLNKLIVRLVFCLYAEDSEMFSHGQFQDYISHFDAEDLSDALYNLFQVLDTPEEYRRRGLKAILAAFPYTNGGLFHDKEDAEDNVIPELSQEVKDIIAGQAAPFNWKSISPTIFGGIFESTLNPETRRKDGMHYTSIENIHKVIDPLFLDDLKNDLNKALDIKVNNKRKEALIAFQDKIAGLKFLDPACGSGNFLTETYLSLRRLENLVIKALYGEGMLGFGSDLIKVSIYQFYGIEINDFAVAVATTALWISEAQMLCETESIIAHSLPALPLKTYENIYEGNALRMDWNKVLPASELNFIMGNPPFVGKKYQTKSQKEDMNLVFNKMKGVGNLDYVTAWYKKAATYLSSNRVSVAFVSTNSIVQGEHIPLFWKTFVEETGAIIHFAHRTFKWENESKGADSAAVHCVIIGWGLSAANKRLIYDGSSVIMAKNVHPYLLDMPNVFVENRSRPLQNVSPLVYGSFALDDGNYTISDKEYKEILTKEPGLSKYLKLFIGSEEFIKGKMRYCVWLKNADIAEVRRSPILLDKISKVKKWRESSTRKETAAMADYPMLFAEDRQPDKDYLAIPITSSERRQYVPMGYMSKDIIASNHLLVLPNATLYEFGCLISSVHMAWMRVVCGRLETRYNYSARIVYNNFPWPTPTEAQKAKIEETAQEILDARALYLDSSLADLYDDLTMPPELRKAHRANDAAVMEAYGFRKDMTEPEIVAELFKMYQNLVDNEQ